jgi:putative flippase GtrA
MNSIIKNDLKISVVIGVLAGILILPTIRNLGIELNMQSVSVAIFSLAVITPVGYLVAFWANQWIPIALQFMKFAIVGGLNAMIDLGVLNLLIAVSGVSAGLFYSFFKAISFLAAVINSYFWNKYWTFQARETASVGGEFIKFFLVNLLGFGINVGTASFVVNVIGAPAGISLEVWANVGAATASIAALLWNFIGMKFVVFKR